MGKELSVASEDTSLSLSLNSFLYYHEFSFKELKLFLELYASYVTLVGNVIVNPFTCNLAFGIDHMLKCSSPCAYLEKQLLVSVARTKPSYHDLELLNDNLFLDLFVANFSSSCASMWSKIHIFFGSFVESGYDERISRSSWTLYSDFHAKFKREVVGNCDVGPLVHDSHLSGELDIDVKTYFKELQNNETEIEWNSEDCANDDIDEDSIDENDEDFDT
ncbi:hypothetical protein M9H77_29702 [Catharanthus roseus]|uniref:Uncharacterized protein n=1 Tax=Catharanthus roseus TaxID=4058 RepID=A0ACB9ZW86_CATRO|nr:hypothetical protein M9H77_29702 [Catharanthus roseus]